MRRAGFCKFPRHPLGKDVREVARTESCELWLQSLELRWSQKLSAQSVAAQTKALRSDPARGVASNHLVNISKNGRTVSLKVEKNRPHHSRCPPGLPLPYILASSSMIVSPSSHPYVHPAQA